MSSEVPEEINVDDVMIRQYRTTKLAKRLMASAPMYSGGLGMDFRPADDMEHIELALATVFCCRSAGMDTDELSGLHRLDTDALRKRVPVLLSEAWERMSRSGREFEWHREMAVQIAAIGDTIPKEHQ